MCKVCPRCVLAIGVGLAVGTLLLLSAKSSHLWSILAVGLGVAACMVLGERSSGSKKPDVRESH